MGEYDASFDAAKLALLIIAALIAAALIVVGIAIGYFVHG